MSSYLNLKKRKEGEGEVVFEAELAADVVDRFEEEVLREAGENLSIPGFRKGKVPSSLVQERMDPIDLLEEATRKALPSTIHDILKDKNVSVLGQPEVAIVKLAPGNPVVFTVRFALVPEVKLPDYKGIARKIAQEEKRVEVTPEEVEEAVEHVRDMFRGDHPKKGNDITPPELTDDFVKKLGPYKDIAEFKEGLKQNLLERKELNAKEKRRETMVQAIVAATKIDIPKLLINQELAAFLEYRDEDLERAGITLKEYLKQVKKTEEELEKEEKANIERQIASSLVMGAMRKKEKITADEKDTVANIATLKRRYPNRTDAELWESAEAIATQKKLFDVLEGAEQNSNT